MDLHLHDIERHDTTRHDIQLFQHLFTHLNYVFQSHHNFNFTLPLFARTEIVSSCEFNSPLDHNTFYTLYPI
jgi:hypothetical protein